MTFASIFGVTIGVAALVVTLSVMGGFEGDLIDKMFKGLPHVEIHHKNAFVGFSLKKYPVQTFRKSFPDAEKIEPFVKAEIVMKNRKHLASVTIFGIQKESSGGLWGFGSGMVYGSLNDLHSTEGLPGIVLGEDLAFQLGVDVGDEVLGLSPGANISDALSGQELSKSFKVVGIFKTQLNQYDAKYAVVSLGNGRFFMEDYDESLDEMNFVSGVALNFKDPRKVGLFMGKLKELDDLKATTWKEVNKSLLFALQLEKFTMSAVLFLIVLVAAFSISGTIMMTVYYKRHQVSLMRALGMKFGDILGLFMSHGVVIGIVGVAAGLSVGIGVCFLIKNMGDIALPTDVYVLKSLPVKMLYFEYALISGGAFVLTILASIYPAYIAAKQEPGTGLRY